MVRDSEKAVEQFLHEQGRTKTWLARQVGMSRYHFYHVLAGRRPARPDFYQRIARVLQVPVSMIEPADSERKAGVA